MESASKMQSTGRTARQNKPFANIEQLGAVPGVDPAKLEQRKTRILF